MTLHSGNDDRTRSAGPFGRGLRIGVGVLLLGSTGGFYVNGSGLFVIRSLLVAAGLVVIYAAVHGVVSAHWPGRWPWLAVLIAFAPLVVVYVLGMGGGPIFGGGEGQLGALTFLGVSLVLAGLRGDFGCEVMVLPNVVSRRTTRLPCLVFSPIDRIERRSSWPPHPLGLGTPFNLASSSRETRSLLRRSWWLLPVLGLVTPLLMLAIDHVLFGGVSLQRVRDLGAQPLAYRLLVVLYSGVTEELIYRLFVATVVAWFAFMALARFVTQPKVLAQWIGILVAALLFGLAHVSNLPDVAHPVLRAVAVNGAPVLLLGWLYWWRGLEIAILTHMVAIMILYIAVPVFL